MCKKKMIKGKKKSNKNKTKQRTVAIDSCRRTSNPDFNFMERRKGIKCGRWVCYKTHFRGAYLFFFLFCKSHLSFTKHFIYRSSRKQECFLVSFFVFKDKFHLPSNMDMKILQNEDLCYFQNSGIDQCCHISIFNFSFSIDGLSLYVLHGDFMFSVILQRSLLTILHTHLKKKKRCGFCLRKARVPDTNSIISRFDVRVKISNWELLNSKKALKFMSLTEYREYHCFFKTTKNVRSKSHIYQIRLRINFEKSGALYMWNLK